jgi:hypothetical protein
VGEPVGKAGAVDKAYRYHPLKARGRTLRARDLTDLERGQGSLVHPTHRAPCQVLQARALRRLSQHAGRQPSVADSGALGRPTVGRGRASL